MITCQERIEGVLLAVDQHLQIVQFPDTPASSRFRLLGDRLGHISQLLVNVYFPGCRKWIHMPRIIIAFRSAYPHEVLTYEVINGSECGGTSTSSSWVPSTF
ncbi:hypothetical protein Mapa_002125 [Marchantia paleacea]|nr:hypothetical protein Mapa_002125 [Marchantia paleacea]